MTHTQSALKKKTGWLQASKKNSNLLAVIGLILLTVLPRFTALNQYIIVDEPDRWRWAKDFVLALSRGNLAATLVGDGYPGIVPVWAESLWIFLEAGRRSLLEGQWIGDAGLGHLLHEWDRTAFIFQQRLPIVLLNTAIALAILAAVWRLFGKRAALVGGILIALDPFYLSDSRVNRAEALITGLMTLSVLFLIFYDRKRQWRYVILSGIFGGLSFLTKIQALSILPVVALVGLMIHWPLTSKNGIPHSLILILKFGALWAASAVAVWVILWPAMWVTPLETLTLVFNYTTRKVGAEGVNLFFMGQTYQNADPGMLFYPVVLLMRLTPLALVGLLAFIGFRVSGSKLQPAPNRNIPDTRGIFVLVIYILLYALIMTIGSHKQDRYLMPIFLSLDILAAIGLVQIAVRNNHSRFNLLLFSLVVIIQIITVLPHHPYYYTYFNPLFGGGQTAARTLRLGWGEGMDLVGEYLAAQPNSRDLVVGTRFTHNMPAFKGNPISLNPDGRWTQADIIVLYIHQVQRGIDPTPEFLDYFQNHRQPEKVVTLAGIDYAWIYPIPFNTPANPLISRIEGQTALLGYSWEANSHIRLVWQNLDQTNTRQIAMRLTSETVSTAWADCTVDPAFTHQADALNAYLESTCRPSAAELPPGLYTVEFGLTAPGKNIEVFTFPQGWQAVTVTASGAIVDTPEPARLKAIGKQTLPAEAIPLDRIYGGKLRLLGYRLAPAQPQPGDTLTATLFWQRIEEILLPLHLTVQLADSRNLPLGRVDRPLPVDEWLYGEVRTTRHTFELSSALETPLAGQLEVKLQDEAEVPLRPTTETGNGLTDLTARFTISPAEWPSPNEPTPIEAMWQNGLRLTGYTWSHEAVTLYWQTDQAITESYTAFVHLLDEAGQIVAQNDSLPRAGAYPTPWWQPDQLVEDMHPLALPPDLPPGTYQITVGFYNATDGQRLLLTDSTDSLMVDSLEVQ